MLNEKGLEANTKYPDAEMNLLHAALQERTGKSFEFRWDLGSYRTPISNFICRTDTGWKESKLPYGFEGDAVQYWVDVYDKK